MRHITILSLFITLLIASPSFALLGNYDADTVPLPAQVRAAPAPTGDSTLFCVLKKLDSLWSIANTTKDDVAKLKKKDGAIEKRMEKIEDRLKDHETRIRANRDFIVATASTVNKHGDRLDGIDDSLEEIVQKAGNTTWQAFKGCLGAAAVIGLVLGIIYIIFRASKKRSTRNAY